MKLEVQSILNRNTPGSTSSREYQRMHTLLSIKDTMQEQVKSELSCQLRRKPMEGANVFLQLVIHFSIFVRQQLQYSQMIKKDVIYCNIM